MSDFAEAMRRAGLRPCDMARLTGRHRGTVWRWCTGQSMVPAYAWTVLRQQVSLRELARAAVEQGR